jgi:hypothetical protein
MKGKSYFDKKTNLIIRNFYPFPLKAVLGIFLINWLRVKDKG